MLGFLLALIVLGLVWYLVGTLPLPAQVKTVITVVFILILLFMVLQLFGLYTGYSLRFPR